MFGKTPGAARVVAVDFDQRDLAEPACPDDVVPGVDQVRRAPALHPDLHDASVLAGGRKHGVPFDDVDADRFLHVHVGAGPDRFDHRQRVPVVGCVDQNDVEVLFLQHVAVIGIRPRPLLRLLARGDRVGGLGQQTFVDVAQ